MDVQYKKKEVLDVLKWKPHEDVSLGDLDGYLQKLKVPWRIGSCNNNGNITVSTWCGPSSNPPVEHPIFGHVEEDNWTFNSSIKMGDMKAIQDIENSTENNVVWNYCRSKKEGEIGIMTRILESCDTEITTCREYHANGHLKKMYSEHRYGGKEGRYVEWYLDATPHIEAFYQNGVLHGPYVIRGQNGHIKSVCTYVDGFKDGISFQYYCENDKLRLETTWDMGKQHGPYISYHKNGYIFEKYDVVNGLKNGKYLRYYESGGLANERTYELDKLNGAFITYYESGNIECKRTYDYDQLEGACTYFWDTLDHGVKKSFNYHKNELHGEQFVYNRDGSVAESYKYENGKMFNESVAASYEKEKKVYQFKIGPFQHKLYRRFSCEADFEKLKQILESNSGPSTTSFWLTYLDESGDHIVVGTDKALMDAIKKSTENNIVRLYIVEDHNQ